VLTDEIGSSARFLQWFADRCNNGSPIAVITGGNMERAIDFGNVLSGLQYLPEREKIILVAVINAQALAQNGEMAKIERLVGQMVIAAARDNHHGTHGESSHVETHHEEPSVVTRIR
jgi:hypothetical protein